MIINKLLFKNKIIYFDYSIVRPTKNSIRFSVLSFVFFLIDKLYVVDFFLGSCSFSFDLILNKSKKIFSLDLNKTVIVNTCLVLSCFYYLFLYNFTLIHFDSFYWIYLFYFFNFSFLVIDPPFFINKNLYLSILNTLFFLRMCVIFYIEINVHSKFSFNFIDFFLLKKTVSCNILYFLFKKF